MGIYLSKIEVGFLFNNSLQPSSSAFLLCTILCYDYDELHDETVEQAVLDGIVRLLIELLEVPYYH